MACGNLKLINNFFLYIYCDDLIIVFVYNNALKNKVTL